MDPDRPLIERLQGGEDLALNELIGRHSEPLFRFAWRYLQDETAARDVVQETFVRVYFKAATYRPRAAVKTWIYSIAINLCRDRSRKLSRDRRNLPMDRPLADDQSIEDLPDALPTPSEASLIKERFGLLERAIGELPPGLRGPLVLCALEGRSHREAAEILGASPKAVELRLYRAKAKLRDAISHLGGSA